MNEHEIQAHAMRASIMFQDHEAKMRKAIDLLEKSKEVYREFMTLHDKAVKFAEAKARNANWTWPGYGNETQAIVDNKYIDAYGRYHKIVTEYRDILKSIEVYN